MIGCYGKPGMGLGPKNEGKISYGPWSWYTELRCLAFTRSDGSESEKMLGLWFKARLPIYLSTWCILLGESWDLRGCVSHPLLHLGRYSRPELPLPLSTLLFCTENALALSLYSGPIDEASST